MTTEGPWVTPRSLHNVVRLLTAPTHLMTLQEVIEMRDNPGAYTIEHNQCEYQGGGFCPRCERTRERCVANPVRVER